MYTPEDILNYHSPKWDELPDIGLYMDQIVSVLDRYLAIFTEDEESKLVTSTMINNYVKQKVVPPPVKKRYERIHIAYFYVLCILKRFLNISEISEGIALLLEKYEPQLVYEAFRTEFEESLHSTFSQNDSFPRSDRSPKSIEESDVIRAVTDAYAGILYARYLLAKNMPEKKPDDAAVKHDKKAEKAEKKKSAENE